MPTLHQLARETDDLRAAVAELTHELALLSDTVGILMRAVSAQSSEETLSRLRAALRQLAQGVDGAYFVHALLDGIEDKMNRVDGSRQKPDLRLVSDRPSEEE